MVAHAEVFSSWLEDIFCSGMFYILKQSVHFVYHKNILFARVYTGKTPLSVYYGMLENVMTLEKT